MICAANAYFVSARHFRKYFLLAEKVSHCVILLLCGLIAIEIVQYAFSIGICDINDVIENFLGAYLGVIAMRLIAVCGKRVSR